MPSNTRSFRRNRKAASPAVSMVIITAATVVLVLVSSLYALQILKRQEAQAEFETTQNSILAFDDALRDIAWDRDGSRSVRFTTQYGNMRLIDASKNFTITASGIAGVFNHVFSTAVVRYQMPVGYGISGTGSYYLLGDYRTVVSRISDTSGQALLVHESELSSITLNYRVRVSEGGTIAVGSKTVNYVDIFVIRLRSSNSIIGASDFDLVCKNIGLTTISKEYAINGAVSVSVSDGIKSNSIDLTLTGAAVVFNLIIADVRVST